jgi:hypothetical protein
MLQESRPSARENDRSLSSKYCSLPRASGIGRIKCSHESQQLLLTADWDATSSTSQNIVSVSSNVTPSSLS